LPLSGKHSQLSKKDRITGPFLLLKNVGSGIPHAVALPRAAQMIGERLGVA
jgi:hypothetical protein